MYPNVAVGSRRTLNIYFDVTPRKGNCKKVNDINLEKLKKGVPKYIRQTNFQINYRFSGFLAEF